MSGLEVKNWFGDLLSYPQAIVDVTSIDQIIAVLKDSKKYPSPVRAVGSNHSTARCAVTDGGTLLRMKLFNRILDISNNSVTAQAGALYIDIAKELEKHRLQFYVNTEIGSLTVGSAACAGTKDASLPGEFGQVGSYITRIKIVLASGELLDVGEDQPDLLQQVRSSYGTLGIVVEATFQVRPIIPMAVHHETYEVGEFIARLPELKARNESMMFYMFPFRDVLTVEYRKYNPDAKGEPNRIVWPLRNYLWKTAGPRFCHEVEEHISDKAVRYGVIDGFGDMLRLKLTNLVHSDNTVATDQIIHYPTVSDDSRYTFSLWAFPEELYPNALLEYFQFWKDYYKKIGYRSNMISVGYRISQDQKSLLSYSFDGNVMTLDPVSTGNDGWKPFLLAYNDFCSRRGGLPLLNQTYGVTREQARRALGNRLKQFADARKLYDPNDRLLNDYFKDLLENA
jgi:hypothetical protein